MWLIKRTLADGWEMDRALEEATLLGLTNPNLRQFMIDEVQRRRTKK
jgi:hypothetical protein